MVVLFTIAARDRHVKTKAILYAPILDVEKLDTLKRHVRLKTYLRFRVL